MKKIFISSILLLALSLGSRAQDMYYAQTLSRNNYYGTARSMALGGAMTALGGDLGSIAVNPAGSAVAGYGQFTITPGLLFAGSNTSYSADGSDNYGSPFKTNRTKFNLPNIGLVMVFDAYDSSWLNWATVGIVANTTNSFLNYTTGRGTNSSTSFLGSLAAGARGMASADMPRDLYAGFAANQFGEFGPAGSGNYVGSNERLDPTERYHYLPATIDQAAMYNTYGSKTDLAFNFGFNVQDCFYFGFNLGTPLLNYHRQDVFTESSGGNSGAFPVIFTYENQDKTTAYETTNYLNSSNTYSLNTSGAGINARFGFIALPTKNLRVGAAIQTPTLYTIKEEWVYSASSSYENSAFNGSARSSVGQTTYNLRTPYTVDAGVAYTLPGVGLLSLDYELMDYSVMKYSDTEVYSYFDTDNWARENIVNRTFCGVSHSLRAGIEAKPLPELSLRAGYSFVTNPEKYWTDASGARVTAETVQFRGDTSVIAQDLISSSYYKDVTHAFSLGAGYSSPGSFFADIAVRLTKYPVSYYSPYYYGAYDALDKDGRSLGVGAPVEKIEHNVIDLLLTLGWRF